MIDLQNIKDFKIPKQKKSKEKKIILLVDTKRNLNNYLLMLKHRKVGGIDYSPHFVISKKGEIFSLLPVMNITKTFDQDIDKKIIKISLENLGWFKKNTILNIYKNWINDVYRSTPYESMWKGFFYWDKYTESQYNAMLDLIEYLSLHYNIKHEYNIFDKNDVFEKEIEGIVSKSNFSDIYTDINPSIKIFKNDYK